VKIATACPCPERAANVNYIRVKTSEIAFAAAVPSEQSKLTRYVSFAITGMAADSTAMVRHAKRGERLERFARTGLPHAGHPVGPLDGRNWLIGVIRADLSSSARLRPIL
jgi:hypothetical protein